VVSLFCLLGWVAAWLSSAFKERIVARGGWLDVAALVAGIGIPVTVLLRVLETTQRIPALHLGGLSVVTLLTAACLIVLFAWAESGLWRTIRRLGRRADALVFIGLHLGLALGVTVGLVLWRSSSTLDPAVQQGPSWQDAVFYGVRLSATYMGYVVFLRVLGLVARELVSVRWRRLSAIARVSVVEATRRMWAPWVVIAVFLVVLAFTHWFLQPPRPAEMGRIYVGTLILLCSLLLTAMITILTPLSLPQDIQAQTIYTVVSKPVRRIELIWGRMLGYMAIVTVLIAVFGVVSLLYLRRTVGSTIVATEQEAVKARRNYRRTEANQLAEQAL